MKNLNLTYVDNRWFQKIYRVLNINPEKESPRPILDSTIFHPKEIEMSGYAFISLFDLMNLFLLLDYCHAIHGAVLLRFLDLETNSIPKLEIEEYNELRFEANLKKLSSEDQKIFNYWDRIYKFFAFLHHFGLFESFEDRRSKSNISFPNITNDFLSKLLPYLGTRSKGTKILPIKPIKDMNDINPFKSEYDIKLWIDGLPQQVKNSPIFLDGEFARVFGYQLGMNIIQHAGTDWIGDSNFVGAMTMRIIPKERINILKDTFHKQLRNVFNSGNERGFIEICVGDRGRGIIHTLQGTLERFRLKYGQSGKADPENVLAFAFSEFGSSKPPESRWGGVHALHRILKCTEKYHGAILIRTGGIEFIYNTFIKSAYYRGPEGLGIYPQKKYIHKVIHPYGVQIQIILPLAPPVKKHLSSVFYVKGFKDVEPHKSPIKVLSPGAYYTDIPDPVLENDMLKLRLSSLANILILEPVGNTIVYDFGEYNKWTEEEIAVFLHSQKSVLHTHRCIGVNLRPGLAQGLRQREELDPVPNTLKKYPEASNFFGVLSAKHRLFPVVDHDGKIWWFGLGRYKELESCFNSLIESKNDLNEIQILRSVGLKQTKFAKESLHHYLQSNSDFLFDYTEEKGKLLWKSKIDPYLIKKAFYQIVRTQLTRILKELNCINDGDQLYKLPASALYTDTFIQTTPLMQNEAYVNQLSEWMASAIRSVLHENIEDVVMICSTAPAELFAHNIGSSLTDYKSHIINIGYFSMLDEERLIRKEHFKYPVIIVADILDRGNTINQIVSLLKSKGVSVSCVVGLIKFLKDYQANEITTVMKWDPPRDTSDNEKIPMFFIAQMRRPDSYEEREAKEIRDEEQLNYIEPFSLETYSLMSLSGKKYLQTKKEKENTIKLLLLEKAGVLREGHWIYGSHHFRATTCVKKLLENDEIAGQICGKIISICKENEIDHIILPLHSHIAHIIPRVKLALKLSTGVDP